MAAEGGLEWWPEWYCSRLALGRLCVQGRDLQLYFKHIQAGSCVGVYPSMVCTMGMAAAYESG